jgi:hypothetical protein
MSDSTVQAVAWKPPMFWRVKDAWSRLRGFVQYRLFRAAMAMQEDGNMIQHAKRELRAAGYDPSQKEEDPDKWIQQNLLDLLRVMAMQGHSGFSAGYLVSTFEKLARFQPLVPLKGDASEWNDVGEYSGEPMWQNNRCGRVFKDGGGRAYDIDGKVFREPDGACFTNKESRVYVTFPYVPKTEYVDVPESKD